MTQDNGLSPPAEPQDLQSLAAEVHAAAVDFSELEARVENIEARLRSGGHVLAGPDVETKPKKTLPIETGETKE